MQIELAKSAGFCFGVKRAIEIALKTAKQNTKAYMLGDIVHNEDVIKVIKRSGIKKISKLTPGKNKILLIRAHGAGKNTFQKAKRLGYQIIDATCPMVKEIHRIAKGMEEKNYRIIIIGDKSHDEVRGITGQLKNKAVVIDNPASIPWEKIKNIKKACVLTQSTQNLENVLKIVKVLKQYIKGLKFFNTICNPTRIKQQETKTIPQRNDIMIIIGSKTSANTRRLFEISKAINKHTYWIQSKKEINPAWFKNFKSAGITAGASTPEWITKEVVKYIRKI